MPYNYLNNKKILLNYLIIMFIHKFKINIILINFIIKFKSLF